MGDRIFVGHGHSFEELDQSQGLSFGPGRQCSAQWFPVGLWSPGFLLISLGSHRDKRQIDTSHLLDIELNIFIKPILEKDSKMCIFRRP